MWILNQLGIVWGLKPVKATPGQPQQTHNFAPNPSSIKSHLLGKTTAPEHLFLSIIKAVSSNWKRNKHDRAVETQHSVLPNWSKCSITQQVFSAHGICFNTHTNKSVNHPGWSWKNTSNSQSAADPGEHGQQSQSSESQTTISNQTHTELFCKHISKYTWARSLDTLQSNSCHIFLLSSAR